MNTEIYISIDSEFVSIANLKWKDLIFFEYLVDRIIEDSDYSYYEVKVENDMYMIFDKKLFDIMNPEHLGKMILFLSKLEMKDEDKLEMKDNDKLRERVENTIDEMLNELVNIAGFSSAILYITDN